MQADQPRQFASRAGLKLAHALATFQLDVTDAVCVDLGCNVGGFTDCLLQNDAARVYAIDTGYNVLAYKLRVDERVVVMERTNALHVPPREACDLAVIDMAWTPQRYALPAALQWLGESSRQALRAGNDALHNGAVVTLVKPHYELDEAEKKSLLHDGRLDVADAQRVLERVLQQMPDHGVTPLQWTTSPITGGKSSRKRRSSTGIASGNVEFLVLGEPA